MTHILTKQEIFKFSDLIFSKEYAIFKYLYDSYDTFVDQTLKNFLEYQKHIISTTEDSINIYVNYLVFSRLLIEEPYNENTNERIYPMTARQNNLTYQIRLFANVSQYQDVINIQTQEKKTRQIGETVNKMLICNLPLMIRSKRCSLNIDKSENINECRYDPGGYFIIKGSEKVLINQDIRINNKPIVTYDKVNGIQLLIAKVSSKTYTPTYISQIITIIYENNEDITLNIPIINKVNVIVIFKVLGIIKDRDIIDLIVYDKNNTAMMNLIIKCIQSCENDKGKKINTAEEALDFLLLKTKVPKKITDENPEIKLKQQKQYLMQLLVQNLFPHIQGTKLHKGVYLGYVIRKLLLVKLDIIPIDEKDSYLNKRVELPGELMFELFKQQFRKTIGECKKHFEMKNKKDDDPILIIPQYKPSIIEQGFKLAFGIGYWLKKDGVAQVLPRLSYPQMISSLRRIDTHIGDPKTNKIALPRYFHPSAQGFLCSLETPEHAKIGLTKHLSLIANITIMIYEQFIFLREYLVKNIIDIVYASKELLSNPNYVLVFLNGELLGITDTHIKIRDELNGMRWKTKEINAKYTSIVYDVDNAELRVYCDGGRFYRPVIRVEENEIKLKKKYIDNISLNHMDNLKGKITTIEEFEDKYNDVIEYIDSELQPYVLLAPKQEDVMNMKEEMEKSLKSNIKEETNKILNRYDHSFFIKYNYCEIHPSLLLGEIVGNVPYCNHIYGVRMTFHYAQGKQASGIYATNYRDRLDISSILYNPQRPLISTKACKYTNYNVLPTGENLIIAIMCYTGYNQEDSTVWNRDSIERGKFMTDVYKKYEIEGMKNQNIGSMDIFTKPDASIVISKNVSYAKLNNEGYCPVGTIVEKGDVIFGKITPIIGAANEMSEKKFRDTSEVYNSTSEGVVVKNYIDLTDEAGNTIRRALIASKREPNIGDKYSSRYGNKSTIGVQLSSNDMPFTANGLKPDLIVNPHAFMTRMSCAQIIEMAVGKICTQNAVLGDGTPFEDYDTLNLDELLEKAGFNKKGTEKLINGETGEEIMSEIFIGPCYYQRLKHLTEDKIHARNRGPRTLLTRQPTEGRSRDGGSRLGEMERDALISLNCAKFLQEKMMNNSDAFIMHICGECGAFAYRYIDDERNKNLESYPTLSDIYKCSLCDNKMNIKKIRLPYACKLLFQELTSMNILPRIHAV